MTALSSPGPVLVTGGTGNLGRAVVRRLRGAGHTVRVLSRKPHDWYAGSTGDPAEREGFLQGDLRTGEGLALAVEGVRTIVHCATNPTGDVETTANLIAAARGAPAPAGQRTGGTPHPNGHRLGHPHLVFVSVVGVDKIPLFYYRTKLSCENLVTESGLPWTIQRATQFHDLVLTMFTGQRRLPLMVVPALRFQPVDVRDVADRLVRHVESGPRGRVPDLGGPEIRSAAGLGRLYLAATGGRQRITSVPLPGRTYAAFKAGHNLASVHASGRITFERFLADRYRSR